MSFASVQLGQSLEIAVVEFLQNREGKLGSDRRAVLASDIP